MHDVVADEFAGQLRLCKSAASLLHHSGRQIETRDFNAVSCRLEASSADPTPTLKHCGRHVSDRRAGLSGRQFCPRENWHRPIVYRGILLKNCGCRFSAHVAFSDAWCSWNATPRREAGRQVVQFHRRAENLCRRECARNRAGRLIHYSVWPGTAWDRTSRLILPAAMPELHQFSLGRVVAQQRSIRCELFGEIRREAGLNVEDTTRLIEDVNDGKPRSLA